jgi:prepilin-type N-terminal cleavage/methylation domain-containing protein/prepilin-type processing-associated H-X9-DG protein
MRTRAFTLIELLVVIAIIAVLAAIALPAFRAVQERAHGVQEANDLRQIGIGFAAYMGDSSDTMIAPSLSYATILGPNTTGATTYVQTWQVFQSPFDSRVVPSTPTGAAPVENVSFAINEYVGGGVAPPAGGTATDFSTYTHPSQLMILAPLCTSPNGSTLVFTGLTTMLDSANDVTPTTTIGTMSDHTKINVLFGDWHVSSMSITNFQNNSSTTLNPGGEYMWDPKAK